MKTHIERLPDFPARVLLEIEVDAARVEAAVQKVYRRVVRDLRIPGFRPGRAPRKIVELHVGKDTLWQEAVDDLVPELYREAWRAHDLEPVDRAEIDLVDHGVDQPLKFTATVDVKPDVELGEYEGLDVERRVRKIGDEQVDAALQQQREHMAQLVSVEKEKLETGDFATIDFDGFIDGAPFSGGAARGVLLEVGTEQVVEGFDEQLVGMAPEEERDVNITFPDNARENLAGKDAVFKVKLLEIKERQLPELDDEFAKDTGEFETLAEMRQDIQERLEQSASDEADRRLRLQVAEAVADNAAVEIPETMIERELNIMQHEMQHSLAHAGMTWEAYLEAVESDEEAWRTSQRDAAHERVKQQLVLEAVGRALEIDLSEEEITERLKQMAGPGRDEAELEKVLADEDWQDLATAELLREQALDRLIALANVTDVEYEEDEDPSGEDEDLSEEDEDPSEED